MRRIYCFLVCSILLLAAFATPCPIFAQENPYVIVPSNAVVSPMPVQESSPSSTKSDYALAYPGLLPDNPLYFLKAIRDNVLNFLITDTAKKSQFALNQSDKRLSAGIMLINNNKTELAKSSISKGNKYMDEAIDNVKLAKKENKPVTSLRATIQDSLKKQKEVITELEQKASLSDKAFFSSILQSIAKQQARI